LATAPCYPGWTHALSHFSVQDDCLSKSPSWGVSSADSGAASQVGFLIAQSQVALKNALAALYQFPRFQFQEEFRLLVLKMG